MFYVQLVFLTLPSNFLQGLKQSDWKEMIEYTYVQDVPKNTNIQKTITKIEHCGARFYHVHDLGGLDPA